MENQPGDENFATLINLCYYFALCVFCSLFQIEKLPFLCLRFLLCVLRFLSLFVFCCSYLQCVRNSNIL